MKRMIYHYLVGCLLVSAVFSSFAQAQTVKPASWRLSINEGGITLIQLAAKNAPLADLAKDLSRQLGVPVRLSALMETQRVNAALVDASVETAMRTLAPQVYLDEIVNLQDASARKLLAVYLSGVNEAAPARLSSLKEQSETILFVGNIDDESQTAEPKESPLQVTSNHHLLNVSARRQPVAVVLYEIAQHLGLSLELRDDNNQAGNQLVDLDLQDQRLEDVLRQLPVPVQLMRRMNLLLGESEPLHIIVPCCLT